MDEEQLARWNGTSGRTWVDMQSMLDRIFRPMEAALVDAVGAGPASVLDIGCGTGATTLAIARRAGACTGVDISEPMLALATRRAAEEHVPARFLRADAQTYAFGAATFDTVVSRFGVMFFDDPVAAFANVRNATKAGGGLRIITWRPPEDNVFMTTAAQAAAALIDVPPLDPSGPGQFGLSDESRVRDILHAGGWHDIELAPLDIACTLTEPELLEYVTRLGPLGRVVGDADEATRTQIGQAVRPAFDPYMDGDQARFTAACWLISAQA